MTLLASKLGAKIGEALEPRHQLTPTMAAALAAAIAIYRTPDTVTAAQWANRCRALERAGAAIAVLTTALDSVDRAFGRPKHGATAPSRRSRFINDAHAELRREAKRCSAAWSAWLSWRHVQRPRHRPRDERRRQLGVAVALALDDAGVPLVVHRRKQSEFEEVLRAVVAHVAPERPIRREAHREVRDVIALARWVVKEVRART